MVVAENKGSGKVTVQFIRTHTNHTPGIGEAKYLPLAESVKQEIKEKYVQSIQVESVLDGMCDNWQIHPCICTYLATNVPF